MPTNQYPITGQCVIEQKCTAILIDMITKIIAESMKVFHKNLRQIVKKSVNHGISKVSTPKLKYLTITELDQLAHNIVSNSGLILNSI
jgi:hypothetical protein